MPADFRSGKSSSQQLTVVDISQIWRLENVDFDVIVVLIYYLYFVGVSLKVKARFITNKTEN